MPGTTDDLLVRLKQTCVYISSPNGSGTGYLIAPQRIGTALHVVKSWEDGQRYPVVLGVGGPTCQAKLLKSDPLTDSAIIGFDETVNIVPMPITDGIERNVMWEAYGFPALAERTGVPTGLSIDGQVKDPKTKNNLGHDAILLYSDQIAAGNASPLHGFSGSPVVVDGALVGHLTKHIGDVDDRRRAAFGYVFASPISAVVKLLDHPPEKVTVTPTRIETRAESIPSIEETAYHVFVSYRSTDRPWAMSLVARLEGAGLRVFIDQRELVPGGYLGGQIESALMRSRAAVLLVSQGWLESPWCQQEANILVKRAVEDATFRLVPLRLDDSEMPPILGARVWLDFIGTKQAQGENLDRLLSALVNRVAPHANSMAARVDAADVRVMDDFVAEIKSAAISNGNRIFEILEEFAKTGSTDVAPLIEAAEVFCGKGFFESALKVLERARATSRVRQLHAFALRKLDRLDESILLLEALYRENPHDPETGGMLAGSYKARWLKGGDLSFRQSAYQVYRETYERTGDIYNGINTAATALQCGDEARMYQVAGEVRDKLLKLESAKLTHWDLATIGEAELLRKRFDDARDWYCKAAGKAAGLHQNIAVMRRQARLNLETLGQPRERFDDVLPVPRILAYFGHMVDADNRPTPRFPKEKIGLLRNVIRSRIEKYGALHGFGQAARGTDLIVLEELVKRDLTATVVLPFPEEEFLALSVGGNWNERFAALRTDKRIEFVPPLKSHSPVATDLPRALADANREVQRLAIEFARRLDESPIVLTVWDGKKGDGPGGTADAVTLWREEGFEPDIVDIAKI
jgi:tetratricopeptide (TPR) repeat protein